MSKRGRNIFIISGPVAFLLVRWLLLKVGCPFPGAYVGGVAAWMCVWWFTEALNFGVTALVPLLMFPMGGIGSASEVAARYTDSIIFLFFGGFMLAFAIEKWGLHHRLSLHVLSVIGTRPAGVLLGVMLCAFLLSNWISNTATTIMLFSAVLAILQEMSGVIEENLEKFEAGVLLGLAFSATIGGMATPIGTPPNMFFFNLFKKNFSDQYPMNFLEWMKTAVPVSVGIFLITYMVLYVFFIKNTRVERKDADFFRTMKKNLGKWKKEEAMVLGIFLFCILAWIFRTDLIVGDVVLKGWQNLHPVLSKTDDSTVAILASILLFTIPSSEKGKALLEWEDAKNVRYDIILMFGSGFALSYGFEAGKLNHWISGQVVHLKNWHPLMIVFLLCLMVAIISEFASNIASVQLVLPLLIPVHSELNLNPLLLMVPATLSASVGFILPVATAANTIVFGTGKIKMKDMLRVGWILDVVSILLITFFSYFNLRG